MLKLPRWLVGAILLLCTPVLPAFGDVTPITIIHFSPGGSIKDFIDKYITIEETGGRVVIDGECISACTLVLGIVDNDRICTTDRGSFAFHTASMQQAPFTPPSFSEEGTKIVWWIYPQNVRDWLTYQGFDPQQPHPDLIFTDASRFVKRCA